MIYILLAPLVQRPRPFGVEFRTDGPPGRCLGTDGRAGGGPDGDLVRPGAEGRWRQIGKWVATGLVVLIALARMYLGVEAPDDDFGSVAIGVAISLLWLSAARPQPGLPDQLPARAKRPPGRRRSPRAGHPPSPARSARPGRGGGRAVRAGWVGWVHSAADHGHRRPAHRPVRQAVCPQPPVLGPPVYKLGRSAYGRLETRSPSNRAPAGPAGGLRAPQGTWPGCPPHGPTGVVELTPEREYLLVTEFFAGATELGEAESTTG